MKFLFVITSLFFLVSCTTSSPSLDAKGYIGETATINDTVQRKSGGKADIFYIQKIDDTEIFNALDATYNASSGRGFQLITIGESRDVPVKTLQLTLTGRSYHSAPIASLLDQKMYFVSGDISFTPVANESYVVNGILDKQQSSVWIEDIQGNVVSNILVSGESGTKIKSSAANLKAPEKKNKRTKEDLFFNIKSGESWDLVKSKLGYSDSSLVRKASPFSYSSYSTVTHRYEGLGSIRFTTTRIDGNDYAAAFVDKVIPEIDNNESVESVKMKLESNNSVTLQALAKNYYLQEKNTVEILDIFADKIMENYQTSDRYMTDALAWLCRVIGKSENSRYRTMLTTVIENTTSSKLRRHASNNLKLLSTQEAEQYSYSKKE